MEIGAQGPAPLPAGDRYWYETNGLDSIVALAGESGALATPYLYDEYGQLLAGTTDLQRFTYTAQDYDPETGLLHFYARYYDPARGVWLTQDPWKGTTRSPETQHRYVYVTDSPITDLDVLGYARHSTAPANISLELAEWVYRLYTYITRYCEDSDECLTHPVVRFIVEKMNQNAQSQKVREIRANNETHYYKDALEEYERMP